ncbi:MAG: universal stress protein [Candidatus Desulfofervidaceae bacterium]|nr:universal stress protein [Candidatus Desulfofervidaceae bacterium]
MAKKILIAIDGSEASMKSLWYVSETIGGCKEIKITLLSILPEVSKGLENLLGPDYINAIPGFRDKVGNIEQLKRQREDEMKAALERGKELLKKTGIPEENIDIKVRSKKEGIAKDILRELEKGGYDTIVVGRRGLTGAFFMGSISDKIVKYAKNCAVWVVD